jgi:hypothetical protein
MTTLALPAQLTMNGSRRSGHQAARDWGVRTPLEDTTTRQGMSDFIRLLSRGGIVEIRQLRCETSSGGRFTASGYFNDPDGAVEELTRIDTEFQPAGSYVTLNPVRTELLARSCNRMTRQPECTTRDNETPHRYALLVDVDPVRPSGISSTNVELANAHAVAEQLRNMASVEFGWPEPIVASMSGNGLQIIYRIDLENSAGSRQLVENTLRGLAARFDTADVKIDVSVGNAARLCKIPGTYARKGDFTPDRPWRRAELISLNPHASVVTVSQLQAIGATPPTPTANAAMRGPQFDPCRLAYGTRASTLLVDLYLQHYRIEFSEIPVVDDRGGRRWQLARCPFHPDHGGRDTVIFQGADGTLGFHCFHARCADKSWADVREIIGPPHPQHFDASNQGRVLRNFEQRSPDTSAGKPIFIARPATDIASNLFELTGGWPKRADDRLFILDEANMPVFFERRPVDALIGWLGTRGIHVSFRTGAGFVTKSEFLEIIRQSSDRHSWLESAPHEPPIPGVFYVMPAPAPGDGQHLERLIDQFCPETANDRQLLKGLVLSLFWGGPAGRRPMWVVVGPQEDAHRGGRGTGKSILVEMMAELLGGMKTLLSVERGQNLQDVKTRLLSPAAQDVRISLLDNVKSLRFSWADLEALITAPVISGRRLYEGEGRRPNLITWIVTINGGALSKDLADRAIVLRLRRPEYSATWEEDTRAFIQANRDRIIGDVISILRREQPT